MESNQKILYEHFKANGMVEEADQILKAYPHLADKPKPEKKKA